MATATLTAGARVRTVEPWMSAANGANNIDPDNYASDAEYLAAIPGMMDSIMTSINAPKSERVSREELWQNV